jgi:RES domain-containing protein
VRAWRICKEKFASTAFDGEGAFRDGGRWNSEGVRVIYIAGSASLATLEVLVHVSEPDDLYRIPYVLIPVDFEPQLVTEPPVFPSGWHEDPPPLEAAAIGDQWVVKQTSLLLKVPSAVIQSEFNYLINPLHSQFGELVIGSPTPFRFDSRLGKPAKSRPRA